MTARAAARRTVPRVADRSTAPGLEFAGTLSWTTERCAPAPSSSQSAPPLLVAPPGSTVAAWGNDRDARGLTWGLASACCTVAAPTRYTDVPAGPVCSM